MEENNFEMDLRERREYRRRRRIKNQIISYISITVILVALIVGGITGVRYLVKGIEDQKQAEELARRLAEMTENEETTTITPPEVVEAGSTPGNTDSKSPLDTIVDNCIAELSLEDKVAGLFFITPEALTGTDKAIKAGSTTQEKLGQYAVGGLIYFKDNIQSKEQLTEMLAKTREMSRNPIPIFLGVDEEGGTVARVADSNIGADKVDTMAAIGKSGDTNKAYEAGKTIGTYLNELGFDLDFAPVADVLYQNSSVLGSRSFGSDPVLVSDMVASAVRGLEEAGVSSCLKHFPGLGNTTEDTHTGMAATDRTLEDMRAGEFIPFKAGIDAGADFVMVSHLSAENIVGDKTPASLSFMMITDILRNELGFEGVVITDALNMAAITDYYTSGEACIKALQAGADMLLMPEDFEEAYQAVLEAVGDETISVERIDESLRRIYRIKYADQAEGLN